MTEIFSWRSRSGGRLTLAEIADRVRLSVSSSHRRLRRWRPPARSPGYRAVINPSAVGLDFRGAGLCDHALKEKATLTAFEESVVELPDVVSAQRLFGEPDYLLRILVADLAAFQKLYDDHLGRPARRRQPALDTGDAHGRRGPRRATVSGA